MTIKTISLLGAVALLASACGRQGASQQTKEYKAIAYIHQIEEEFESFFKLINGPLGNNYFYYGDRDKDLLTFVRAQAQIDRDNLSWVSTLFGAKKARKRFPLVFYAKKIKAINAKLSKIIKKIERGMAIDFDKDRIKKLACSLNRIRTMIKVHPRYEKERDLYELHQAVKSGGSFGFIKPVISIATKIL